LSRLVVQDFQIAKNKMTLAEAMKHEFVSRLNIKACRTGTCASF
jgi:hypothetical protein